MAIDSNLKKFAVLEWGHETDPALPFVPGAIGEEDQWVLLGEYPLNQLSAGGVGAGKLRGVSRAISRGVMRG